MQTKIEILFLFCRQTYQEVKMTTPIMPLSVWLPTTIARLQQNDPTLTSIERINHIDTPNADFLLDADGVALANALRGNTHVTSIDISRSNILDEGGAAIVNVLKDNRTVTSLSLRANGFWVIGSAIVALKELLKVNKTITTLSLRGNQLHAAGMAILCEGLKENTSVHTLHVDYTNMGSDGIIALGKALEVNRTLKHLTTDGNYYTLTAANIFIQSLEKNRSLTTFVGDGCLHQEYHVANIMTRNHKVAWSYLNHAKKVCPELHTLIMVTLMSANKATTSVTTSATVLPRMLPEVWEEHIFPHFNL